MYRVEKYTVDYYTQWNDFVSRSKNGTFLFHRDFMEYHSDRFIDYSLLVFENDKVVALFPANSKDDIIYSHQGLTYGGFLLENKSLGEKTEQVVNAAFQFLSEKGFKKGIIKQILPIYHKYPAFEADYALFSKGANIIRRDMNLAIDYSLPLTISKSKMKHYRRVSSLGMEIRQDNNFKDFWQNVLVPRLAARHNAKPVHTLEEIELLQSRFPENIFQYNVYYNDEIVSGITLFDSGTVVKSQYGATTGRGEELRALDYLFITLIEKFSNTKRFFDMGTVTEADGYNAGLLKQKEELGCNVYIQDFYEVTITE
ncbi:FemAB family protein [Flavobacterium alkalisoli]|uniref:FemAB family protein n=1 Tax=Flavobacterium alkalisoli TaxID=2602769 RepID=A0A5B9G2H3_9FLAO|nr:FemAB family protein [Flavobacterium alkalisoli]QEE51297.1 FemAB family protein [Flavobacterium alkalisoli]